MERSKGLTERQQYWLKHIQACGQLGQTTKTYADSHGLSVSMMYSWRKKLAVRGVLPRQSNGGRGTGFDQVQIVEPGIPAGVWRITLPNGVQVEVVVDGLSQSPVLAALDEVESIGELWTFVNRRGVDGSKSAPR